MLGACVYVLCVCSVCVCVCVCLCVPAKGRGRWAVLRRVPAATLSAERRLLPAERRSFRRPRHARHPPLPASTQACTST